MPPGFHGRLPPAAPASGGRTRGQGAAPSSARCQTPGSTTSPARLRSRPTWHPVQKTHGRPLAPDREQP
eukprot:11165766-Lingulodinium_polyedra.AAC.1